jgi:hypothetical protein
MRISIIKSKIIRRVAHTALNRPHHHKSGVPHPFRVLCGRVGTAKARTTTFVILSAAKDLLLPLLLPVLH